MAVKANPLKVWQQADCFYQALYILCNVHPDNAHIAVVLGEPVIVPGALTIELFLKCLVGIERGTVPTGHHLRELYDQLSDQTRARIQRTWDDEIARHRSAEWDRLEKQFGVRIARDLPTALSVGAKTFERVRYSYEGNTEDLQYYLQDLPQLLGRVVVELRPEWEHQRRTGQPLSAPVHH